MDARPIPIFCGEVAGGLYGQGEFKWEYEVDEEGHKHEEPRHIPILPEAQVFEGDRALVGSYFVMVNLGIVVANYVPETYENSELLPPPSVSLLPDTDQIALNSNGDFDLTLMGQTGSYGNEISPQLALVLGGPAVRFTIPYRIRFALWSVPDRTDVNT